MDFFTRRPHWVFLGFVGAITIILVLFLRPAPPEKRLVLRYAHWGDPAYLAVAAEICRAFERAHPEVKIREEFTGLSRDYWTKLKTQFPAGVGPDIIFVDPGAVPEFASRGGGGESGSEGGGGVLLPLDEQLADDKAFRLDAEHYYAPVVDAFRHRGKLYAVPTHFSTIAIFYNKRLFDRFHVPYPDPDWDWEQFRQTARKLTRDTDGDGKTDVWGFSGGGIHPERGYGNFVWANGGRFLNDERTRVVLADETPAPDGRSGGDDRSNRAKVEEAIQFALDLAYKDKVTPPLGSGALGNLNQWQNFAGDQLAMTIAPAYLCQLFNQDAGARDIYGAVPFPRGPRGARGSALICYGNVINARLASEPEKLALAWEFLKFYASAPMQELIARRGRDIPVLRDVAERPDGPFLGSPDPPEHREYFLRPVRENQLHDVFAMRGYQEWFDRSLRPVMAEIFRQKKTIRQGLREIARDGNDRLEEIAHPPEYRPSRFAWLPLLLLLPALAGLLLLTRRRAREGDGAGAPRTAAAAAAVAAAAAAAPVERTRLADLLRGAAFLAPNFLGFLLFTSLPVVASLLLAFCEWDILRPPRFTGLKNFDLLLVQGIEESAQWLAGAAPVWWRADLPRALAAGALALAALFLLVALANSRAFAQRAAGGIWRLLFRCWPVPAIIAALALGGRPDLLPTFLAFPSDRVAVTAEWPKRLESLGMHAAAAGGVAEEEAQLRFAWTLTEELGQIPPAALREDGSVAGGYPGAELVGGWNPQLAAAVGRAIEQFAEDAGQAAENALARRTKDPALLSAAREEAQAHAWRPVVGKDDAARALEAAWPEAVVAWGARLEREAARAVLAIRPGTAPERAAEFAVRFRAALLGRDTGPPVVGAGHDPPGLGPAQGGRGMPRPYGFSDTGPTEPENQELAAGRLAGELGLLLTLTVPEKEARRDFARQFLGRFEGRFLGPEPVRLGWADALLAAALAAQLLLLCVPFFDWTESPRTWRRRLALFLDALRRASPWLVVLVGLLWLADSFRLASLVAAMRLPGDARFWQYLYNTVFLTLTLPIHMCLSLSLALLVHRKLVGVYAYRLVYFIPSITAGVAIYMIWTWIYNNDGLLNATIAGTGDLAARLLSPLGVKLEPWRGKSWLDSLFWAKPALMLMELWITAGGFQMILYLAGLAGIDPQLYEAAEMDGASRWARFRHVTWPMLYPTTFFIFVMGLIHGLEGGFDRAYVMTAGGPGGSTTTLSYYIFSNAYQWFNMGYAAAVAWVLFLLVFAVTVVNWRYLGRTAERSL